MSDTIVVGTILCLIQVVAALPWLAVLDPEGVKSALRKPSTWGFGLAGILLAGAGLAVLCRGIQDPARLVGYGRIYGAVLQAQLSVDLFVLLFALLLPFWSKGGSVALASFREGVRQPMFWLLVGIGLLLMVVCPFIPYFTFGEDYKMVRELGYDTIMLLAALFAVLNASISISEEIEGRTAVTLMSKPISRRQFFLGKFVGIFLATTVMTSILGLAFAIVLWYKPWFDGEPLPDPAWTEYVRQNWTFLGESTGNFTIGAMFWFDVMLTALPGLILGLCQVMVLLAVAVALATRLPMVVNVVVCSLVFFMGSLTAVLVQASQSRYALVQFIARVFDTVLPSLEFFSLNALIAKDIQPPPLEFSYYLGSVIVYALFYTASALLFGLILFEDRDLA